MAGTTKLATDVQGGLSSVFLLWDPAGFEESTGSLRYLDGTLPAADSDEDWWNMVYKWDCLLYTSCRGTSASPSAAHAAAIGSKPKHRAFCLLRGSTAKSFLG